jgi:hypothetical protein
MKYTAFFLLVGCLAFSLFSLVPAQARDNTENARDLMLDSVSGSQQKSADEVRANRENILTFKSSDDFPVIILKAIRAHFTRQKLAPAQLEQQDTIQMGGKGRIYYYSCRFAGHEKQYSFLFATLYKDATKQELVYKAFFCTEQAQFEGLREQGEKILKDTLAYETPKFSFYRGYEIPSD